MPWQADMEGEGLLACGVRVAFPVALEFELQGCVGPRQANRGLADADQGLLQPGVARGSVQGCEIEVLGEAVVAEVALLEGGASLEGQGFPEFRHLGQGRQDPGQDVVPLQDFPGDAGPTADLFHPGS